MLTGTILLLVFIAVHAFNIEYQPVTGGLDPSWRYIINEAARHRSEFIFTSGPLGFINYPPPLGANLEIAGGVRLLVWQNYFPLRNVALFAGLFALGSSLPFDYFLGWLALFCLSLAVFAKRWRGFYLFVIGLAAMLGLMTHVTHLTLSFPLSFRRGGGGKIRESRIRAATAPNRH